MKLLNLDWSRWFYGMWVSIVTGASNSVIAGLTLKLMDDTVFNRNLGTFMEYIGVLFVVGAIKDFFLYINGHPAPEIVSSEKRETVQVTQIPLKGTGDGSTAGNAAALTKTVTTKVQEEVKVTPVVPPEKP